MARKTRKLDPKLQAWIEARKRHHLSHAQVQMARELGLNPAKLGKLDHCDQEPWKLPLPQFIAQLYAERFGRSAPGVVMSIEERVRLQQQKKDARRAARAQRVEPQAPAPRPSGGEEGDSQVSRSTRERLHPPHQEGLGAG